jgi:hypothetical protein
MHDVSPDTVFGPTRIVGFCYINIIGTMQLRVRFAFFNSPKTGGMCNILFLYRCQVFCKFKNGTGTEKLFSLMLQKQRKRRQ